MTAAADGEAADLVVLNTCHIREKAAEKVYSDIGRLRSASDGGTAPMIAVAGCVAQAEGAEIARRAPGVDIVVGPQAYHNLPALVARGGARRARRSTPTCRLLSKFGALPARRAAGPERLPDRAGRLRQILHLLRRALYARRRNLAAVRRDRRRGEGAGRCRRAEITLLGQNVNAWARGTGARPRRPDPRARRAAGPRPHPLHDQPSQRHDRRA